MNIIRYICFSLRNFTDKCGIHNLNFFSLRVRVLLLQRYCYCIRKIRRKIWRLYSDVCFLIFVSFGVLYQWQMKEFLGDFILQELGDILEDFWVIKQLFQVQIILIY